MNTLEFCLSHCPRQSFIKGEDTKQSGLKESLREPGDISEVCDDPPQNINVKEEVSENYHCYCTCFQAPCDKELPGFLHQSVKCVNESSFNNVF